MPKGVYPHKTEVLMANLSKTNNLGSKRTIEQRKKISESVKQSYKNNPLLRKLRSKIFLKNRTPLLYSKMVKTRISQGSYRHTEEQKKKQRASMIKLYDEHPEKHPNRRMANRKTLFSQERLFNYVKTVYPEAVMEFRIPGTRRFADIAIISKKLDIEFDGKRWHNEYDDSIRDAEINRVGWNVMHFDSSVFKVI